jgi:hypothetical protein
MLTQRADCAPFGAQTTALNATGGNPHTLDGALVEFASFSDSFPDVRTLNDTRVSIDNNAGAVSALAGLAVASGSWDQCLQVRVMSHIKHGLFRTDYKNFTGVRARGARRCDRLMGPLPAGGEGCTKGYAEIAY